MDKKPLEKLNRLDMRRLASVSVKNNKIIFSMRAKDHVGEIIFDRDEFDIHQETIKIENDIEKFERMSIEEGDEYLHIYNFLNPDIESIHIVLKNSALFSDGHFEQEIIVPFDSKKFTYYVDRPSVKRIEISKDKVISQNEFENKLEQAKEIGAKYAEITENTVEITLRNDEIIKFDRSKFIAKYLIGRNALDRKWFKKLNLYGDNSVISIGKEGISFKCGNLSLWVANKQLILEEENFIKEVLKEMSGKLIEITKPFKLENYKTRADLLFLLLTLIKDFGIPVSPIRKHYKDAYLKDRKDTVEIILLRAIKGYAGTTDKDFATAIPEIFHELLVECSGYATDWKYDDTDVEWQLNKKSLLGKYKLKCEFSKHKWDEPFKIRLIDLKENKIISLTNFEYSKKDYHDQRELIDKINKIIAEKNLVFVNAEDGSDSFQFVLFDIPRYKELKERYYEDFDKLIRKDTKENG